MKLYAVQHDILWEDKPANFERVSSMLAKASPTPGSLIVLEEMFATGFTKNLSATREAAAGETESFLRDLALRYQCCVIGGLVGCGEGDKGRNESLAITPDGTELARYVKMQPFSAGDEHLVHEAGTRSLHRLEQGFALRVLIRWQQRAQPQAHRHAGTGKAAHRLQAL